MAAVLAATLLGPAAAREPEPGPEDEPTPFLGWEDTGPWWSQAARPTVHGAATLDEGLLGVAAGLGFPFMLVDVVYGTSPRTDVRAGLRTVYGAASTLEAGGRLRLHGGRVGFAVAGRLDAGWTFHTPGEVATTVAGLRDASVRPGLVASLRALSGACLFLELGFDAVFEIAPEPLPLEGPPPPVRFLLNVPLHLGVELPVSSGLSFFGAAGVDLRLLEREDDSAAPYFALGLTLAG